MKTGITRRYGMVPLVGVCLALVTTGCAKGPPRSGFLKDYSGLEKVHDDALVWNFIDPSGTAQSRRTMRLWADHADWSVFGKYDQFMLDP